MSKESKQCQTLQEKQLIFCKSPPPPRKNSLFIKKHKQK